MKRLISVVLLIAIFMFAGCTKKSTDTESIGGVKDSAVTADKTSGAANSNTPAAQSQSGSSTLKPGTMPQLSDKQKRDVNSEINSALNNLDNTLKSLQDPQDINLDSVN